LRNVSVILIKQNQLMNQGLKEKFRQH